eukprot:TRINITY_DN9915_c0_g1_i1.p1 TRINITY_DN9915_c0_g1~~TRINITY_DN9915_c0_g1_i1.p1  ORF type:complete len:402 (+),score=107.62 TRINITY_DN9915_c0_g1_i1:60-1265(+)
MAFVDIFGDTLLTQDGPKPTAEHLSGKTAVGIYFSAHWCPPCRGFTPTLANMYNETFKAKGMEIVFVSSDKDDSAFKDYFGEMPWAALPFEKRDLKEKLSKQFKVRGIPTFVILGPDGKLITDDGRSAVNKDPKGEKYPWYPPTKEEKAKMIVDALGPELVAKASGKYIGLYFSAHWCPPCRGFTPKLAEWYNAGLKDKLEVIFVSSDRDEASFKEYFGEMPWSALPFEKRDAKGMLSEMCGVEGIPSFAILNPDGSILTTDGRSKVSADPKGETLPQGWLPQPFNDVNDDPNDLNEEMCVISLGNNAALHDAVKEVASEHYKEAKEDISAMSCRFFKAPDGEITSKIRGLMKLEGDKLLITDLSSGGTYYVCEEAVSDAAGVKAFLGKVKAGEAAKKTLG